MKFSNEEILETVGMIAEDKLDILLPAHARCVKKFWQKVTS